MEILVSKILALVCLGVSSFLLGLLPLCLINRIRWPLLTSILLCFGAGVLLATSLIHILPEVKTLLPENAEIIFCGGFFMLYVIDEIVHYFYGESHGHSLSNSSFNLSYGSVEQNPLLYSNTQYNRVHSSDEIVVDRPPSQICHVGHQEPCNESKIGHLGLLVALCVHAVLEGLAVGLEETSAKVMLLLGAVACHKLVVGFCLGIELLRSDTITVFRYVASIATFAFGSSAGIAAGIGIGKIPANVSTDILPIFQGLAGGTLLYVTVCEVLPRERARWHQQHAHRIAGVIQLLSVLAGFATMTATTKYLDFN